MLRAYIMALIDFFYFVYVLLLFKLDDRVGSIDDSQLQGDLAGTIQRHFCSYLSTFNFFGIVS